MSEPQSDREIWDHGAHRTPRLCKIKSPVTRTQGLGRDQEALAPSSGLSPCCRLCKSNLGMADFPRKLPAEQALPAGQGKLRCRWRRWFCPVDWCQNTMRRARSRCARRDRKRNMRRFHYLKQREGSNCQPRAFVLIRTMRRFYFFMYLFRSY